MEDQTESKTPPAPVRLADEALALLQQEGLVPDRKLIEQLRGYALRQAKAGNVPELAQLVAAARQGPDFFKTVKAALGAAAGDNHRSYESVIAKLNAKAPVVELSAEEKFQKACREGNLEDISSLLEQDSVDRAALDNRALLEAAIGGHVDVVRLLLEQDGIDPAAGVNQALRWAAIGGHVEVVRLLLEQDGINPAAGVNQALMEAARCGHVEVVRLLLEQDGIDPAALGNQALRWAAIAGHVEVVRLLLEHDSVDPAAGDNEALRWTAGEGHVEVVRLLLEQDSVNPAAWDNQALQAAARGGHVGVVGLLLEQDSVNPAALDNQALREAARYGHVEVVRLLLEHDGVDPAALDNQALRGAAENGYVEVVDLLLEHGATLSVLTDKEQERLTHYRERQQSWIAETGGNAPDHLLECDPSRFRKDSFAALLPMLAKEGYHTSGPANVMAYHAAALFETEARVLAYLERWGVAGKQPLHDLIYDLKLPDQGTYNFKDWQAAVMACGPVMAKLMKFADKVPSPLRSDNGKDWSPLKTRAEIAKNAFNRAAEHPELAALCFDHLVGERTFEKALDIVQQTGPQIKNIPDITLDGKEFGLPGGKFYRLPANDIRGLFLGKLTDCCQSVDGAGHDCAVHGYTSRDGGFYIVENAKGQIVAQTWAWRGKQDEMCWDTLEVLGQNVKPAQWEKLLKAAANDLAARQDHNVTALTVGTGGDTPTNELRRAFKAAEHPAKPRNYKGYRESSCQIMIWQPRP